ncbi:pyridoxal phosphate phosphatase [Cronobacter condimenti 1330]|uniref:Pyridoxal phosphate phosphatase n=2 Tax=Cronobacter condimenti 1330 TaxID=1073999 RepID=A0ABN4IF01_9ENTR|nr:pyridoxal phosphatase [Cronobacter condimenti]ALB64717.1 pyridoxal phosphate phosphatase [Cronobacter condimenti 1330]
MTFRVIALDLDGTLLTAQKSILPESLDALALAKEAGLKPVIVTGRHHNAIHPFYQALALDTPAICCNGTYLYDYQAKKVLTSDPMTPQQAEALIELLNDYGIHSLMYVDDVMLYERACGHIQRTENWAQRLPEAQRPVFRQVASLQDAVRSVERIWKFALTGEDIPRLQSVALTIERELNLACEWSWHDQVDVAAPGNSKGNRLAQWVESQGLTMDQVVAFGDNHNDISMLERAGLGIAMGNADDIVKSHADKVIGPNTEPSIADALRQWVL